MRITVTEQDIQRGIPENSCRCPVARAVRRATRRQHVYASQAFIDVPGHSPRYYDTPADVRDWMTAFDTGKPVEPISFELVWEDS